MNYYTQGFFHQVTWLHSKFLENIACKRTNVLKDIYKKLLITQCKSL